jgi:hypothetical protein
MVGRLVASSLSAFLAQFIVYAWIGRHRQETV